MTPEDRIRRATQASLAYEEFIAPMIGELRGEYAARIVEVANAELNAAKRADKLTALSLAHRILTTLDGGMHEMIRDGDLAERDKLRADKIEKMTPSARRLFNMVP